MRIKKVLKYVKGKVLDYPKIDLIIEGLELSKDMPNNKDVNSFIKSKNSIHSITESQAITNANVDKKIDELLEWQTLIRDELEYLKINDNEVYRMIMLKYSNYSFSQIKDKLYLGERTVTALYDRLIIEITVLAVEKGLVHL